jgi:hypothetical protein
VEVMNRICVCVGTSPFASVQEEGRSLCECARGGKEGRVDRWMDRYTTAHKDANANVKVRHKGQRRTDSTHTHTRPVSNPICDRYPSIAFITYLITDTDGNGLGPVCVLGFFGHDDSFEWESSSRLV